MRIRSLSEDLPWQTDVHSRLLLSGSSCITNAVPRHGAERTSTFITSGPRPGGNLGQSEDDVRPCPGMRFHLGSQTIDSRNVSRTLLRWTCTQSRGRSKEHLSESDRDHRRYVFLRLPHPVSLVSSFMEWRPVPGTDSSIVIRIARELPRTCALPMTSGRVAKTKRAIGKKESLNNRCGLARKGEYNVPGAETPRC